MGGHILVLTVRRIGVVLVVLIAFVGAQGRIAVGQPPVNLTPVVPGTTGSSVSVTAVSIGGRVVSATGIGDVGYRGVAARPLTVTAYLQTRTNGADLRSAVQAADQKAAAVRASVEALGISPLRIRSTSTSVAPEYGPAAQPGGDQVIRGYLINRSLQVDISGPDQTEVVMRAAILGGATSVSAFPAQTVPMTPPSSAAIASAAAEATRQAEAAARAAAAGLGVSLGGLQRVMVGPPHPIFVQVGQGVWQVEVTVIYALASPR